MKQIIKPIVSKTVEILKTTRATILPFTEHPSEDTNNFAADKADGDEINAADLFSMFTADIIKENVVFTR